ncbi:PH domain-containing protein [Halomonas sp. ANAO-440]|uniref:PH domain-containing protein n=1 Tax=Halomonas sp. ANAO-440 TaxID=2861360 RepID=UPI001CAA4CE9|nr:PH domain-containing protein [Halomonas sp. ANAO-440]MBZ0331186.1 PH domain-containing protein [Halomonas sp. ANAO-440]
MTFDNPSLDPEGLPKVEHALLTPVSRRLAPCQSLLRLFHWAFLTLVAWFFPVQHELLAEWQPWIAAGVAGLGMVVIALGWVEASRRGYGLREHDLIYRRGLLVCRTQVLPLVRLQHVETLSNPVERAFGLVRLACFTAGGRGADLLLEGLSTERAEAVKQHLLMRLSATPDDAATPESNTP